MEQNKSVSILRAAEAGKYGIPAVCCYNLEAILAVVRAAENKKSPAMILLFPWALQYASSLLVNLAADACRSSTVPVSLHLDHAQDEATIRQAALLPFDSIMVDMSHYEKADNLARTKALVRLCHERGIACEAEPGRIEGGEDGVKDTADLEGMLTTPEEALQFVDTGIDFLAPAFGNVHGLYGPRGIHLEYERLDAIHRTVEQKKVHLVLHGTDGFDETITRRCISHGITKININSIVREKYAEVVGARIGSSPLTHVMEEATRAMQEVVEEQMDICMSTGKAS
ncbi:MAG: hypothetical protein M1838_004379 [Thelocarpon superellum]|nr:MAG: hypothetical protein M1838_004379 [Thelocarpon superellum]